MDESDVLALCDRVRKVSFALHGYLRHGHLEKVYENGLAHRLKKDGISFEQQFPLKVSDEDDAILGEYYADFLIEGFLVTFAPHVRSMASSSILAPLG
jgi:GxxExxY protein